MEEKGENEAGQPNDKMTLCRGQKSRHEWGLV